jgi:hypothetical protein
MRKLIWTVQHVHIKTLALCRQIAQQQFLYKEQIINLLYTFYVGMSKQDDLNFATEVLTCKLMSARELYRANELEVGKLCFAI